MLSKSDLRTSTFLQRVASWPDYAALEGLDAASLRHITKEYGVDFATALLFDRFRKSSRHSAFIRRIEELCNAPSFDGPRVWSPPRVMIVPGALYLERPDMGGDGRMIREVAESFGCRSGLVPLASLGSVSENAHRLAAWLKQQPDEKLILVSLSKGGADLKLALQSPDAPRLFRNVLAWINVCGPLDGSPMANWILSSRVRTWLMRFQYWAQRRDFGFISELRHGAGSALNTPLHWSAGFQTGGMPKPHRAGSETGAPTPAALRLPLATRMISLVGFPLRGHMTTPFSRFCHRTLSKWGPNDGTVLLSDASQWPGEIYPVWGADHYFRPENRARALITAVLRYLAEGATQLMANSARQVALPSTSLSPQRGEGRDEG
jgi:hypothetical protein